MNRLIIALSLLLAAPAVAATQPQATNYTATQTGTAVCTPTTVNNEMTFSCAVDVKTAAMTIGPLTSGSVQSGTPVNPVFTPLHTYYMAASSCSDSNNGTSPSTPWCTPNHAVVCGDAIIAAAGTYNGEFATWGTVSTCLSTTGGIDGAGGIYAAVLLCGGSNLGSGGCLINCATAVCNQGHVGSGGGASSSAAMNVNQIYWSIQSWTVNGNGASHRGFQVDGCLTKSTVVHHVSFINDIAYNTGQAASMNDCGYSSATNGGDYFAVVAMIAQNAAQDSICLGAIDAVGAAIQDTTAGTHFFINTSYSYYHPTTCNSDVEAFLIDTPDFHNVSTTFVISNNIGWQAARMCINDTESGVFNPAGAHKFYNNTCFEDNTNVGSDNGWGEINFQLQTTSNFVISVYDNIAYQPLSVSPCCGGGGNHVAALALDTNPGSATWIIGGSGLQNILLANTASCWANFCSSSLGDTTNAAVSYVSLASIGTNTYANPGYTNTTDLLANWIGAPSCAGFTTTTACMGYNAVTATLTTLTPISDLQSTYTASDKGYQLPSTTCAANADYPTWLKGLNTLHWNGSQIIEVAGNATKPCGY